MNVIVDVQYALDDSDLPDEDLISSWVKAALAGHGTDTELTIRIVDENEGKELNEHWRKSSGSTNVLSFPSGDPVEIEPEFLGDIVICAPVAKREACQQNKALEAHWAHLVIHGTLHLTGYDHINEHDAKIMESLETRILKTLGFDDPYI